MNTVLLLCSLLVGSALGGGFVNTFTIASVSAEWGAYNGWASNLLPSNKPCANTATIWNAGRDWNDYPQGWIVFDLASGSNTFNVQGVVYNAAGDGVHDPNLVQIQTSSSVSGPWTTVTSFNGEFSTNKSQVFLWSAPTAARYWKFNIVSTATGYQAYVGYINFIYTAIVPLPTPAPTPAPTSAPTAAPTPTPNPAAPATSPTNCPQWTGSTLPNNVKFQLYHAGYQASHGKGWLTYTPIYGGEHPLGLVLDASPKTFTLDSVGNAKWPTGTAGQEGRIIGDNGVAFTNTWGGDYITPGTNSWGVSLIRQTAPFVLLYHSQISAAWGYNLGVQAPTSTRGNQILINRNLQDTFAVYICP